ncbi:unnamed protein product, partial [Oikopleura dioica]
ENASQKNSILDFLINNFHDNTLQIMLPLSENEMRNFWGSGLAACKESQLVYQNVELVAVENGDFLTYKEIKEEFDEKESVKNAQRTSELICALGETDLTRFGVNDRSKIYSNGVVCVSSLTQGRGIGTRLIKNSINFAKNSGADFYTAHCVNNISKKVFEKEGFEIAKNLSYPKFFKNEPEEHAKIVQAHQNAFFMIKKLY